MAHSGSFPNSGGYNCIGCGMWIPYGTTHACCGGQTYQQQWPSQDALILTELRLIHELLRKVLLKEKTVAADAAQEGEANAE